jgi:hypothetical protein
MTPTIAFMVWLCLSPLTPSQLRVELVFSGLPMRTRVEAAAMREVRRIWSAYGVDVRDVSAREPQQAAAVRLSIALVNGDTGAVHTLGTTQFVDGQPLPSIALYPDAIAALLSSEYLMVRGCIRWAPACQDLINGRVLGRALAHEMGHYLLRSRGHSANGLMRAQPPAAALIEADVRPFLLSAQDARQLAGVRRPPCRE